MNKLRVFKWLGWCVLIGGLLAYLMSLQERLLYFPSKVELRELEAGGLRPWPSGDAFRGLIAEAVGLQRGTVIVFHGNAGHAGHRAYYAEHLTSHGLRVILAEYPGYGPRDGSLGEASLVADASETIERAYAMYGSPMVVVGESLGSGVAAAALKRQHNKVTGLLMITPWNRLEVVVKHHFPWLPVEWLLRDRYDSEENLREFSGPVAVLVAEEDQTVPATFGQALYEGLRANKRMTILNGAGHNDWATKVAPSWWGETMDFLLGR